MNNILSIISYKISLEIDSLWSCGFIYGVNNCFLFLCFYHNIVWCIFILHRCVCVCVSVFKGRGNFVRSFSSVSTVLASVEIKQPPAERNKHQKCILFSNKRVSQCIPSAFHPKWWSDKCFFFFFFFFWW